MSLQKLFQRKENEDPTDYQQAYIQQLFKMAHSDGHMDECEYHFILKVAQRLEVEINFEELHQCLEDITLDASACRKFGFDLLFDLSWLMLVDGEIDDRELKLGMDLGSQLGFRATNVRQMVLSIGQHKKLGMPPSEIKQKLKQRFGPE